MDNLATGEIIQAITKNSINSNQNKLKSYIFSIKMNLYSKKRNATTLDVVLSKLNK